MEILVEGSDKTDWRHVHFYIHYIYIHTLKYELDMLVFPGEGDVMFSLK